MMSGYLLYSIANRHPFYQGDKRSSISGRIAGSSFFITSQTISQSTLKYAWISLSRRPAISLHGTSACSFLNSFETFFAASPIISRLLSTDLVFSPSDVKSSKEEPSVMDTINRISSLMWFR